MANPLVVFSFTSYAEEKSPPITFKFGVDSTPTEPPENPNKEVGSYFLVDWLSFPTTENAVHFDWTSIDIFLSNELAYKSINITEASVAVSWLLNNYEQTVAITNWSIGEGLLNSIEVPFKNKMLRVHKEQDLSWLNNLDIEHNTLLIPWKTGPINESSWQFDWRVNPELKQKDFVIYYGQTDKEYICYWRNHPFKGYVKLDFNAPYQARTGSIKMRFNAPDKVCYWGLPGGLVRGDDDIPTIDRKIPIEPQIRKTYIMQPTINCVRLSDDVKILISSINYSVSRSQFSASCSLKFCSRIDFERALGQELKISVNGYDFYVICEQPSTANRFANSSYSASCRGRFALLSAPYARATNYANPTAKTLAGIMSDILVNTGWSLDNKMIDYPIPTGAFTYTDLTPAAALLSVAKSVGAMLDIDNANKTVSVIPAWPVMPWDTENAICDVILNDSIILEHNTSQTINQAHNAVFVRGEQQGVACKIKRAGTLGDQFAGDVVDSLITDNQAARQRGSYELANSGNKQQSTIRTKLLNDLPPIRPGMLVGVTYGSSTYKATCDNMDISASISDSGAITVSQTIKVISNV
ncbi:hypothetical protein H4J63_02165 [Pseudoalteromonas sp. 5Ae-yellow]|uniref:hypothetical protein n=1 Tax=Pseudoalteromonas sp. 5Ae-yellow TaxID=2759847 RepID=UPI0015F578E6|nr:hypothetical protein [Pseudoalteromonas sp. 5Ae-yellow]MBA6408173.1 hypothetical protein [Pseudoalteromonas sp. 5Ae-yellow]